jgi:hypothetical protein
MSNPLDELKFPVRCKYCGAGPFNSGNEVDEHISEEHLAESVWSFAADHMETVTE